MTLDLKEIIDVDRLGRLFDAFYAATNVSVSIASRDGKICTSDTWQKFCFNYYLQHPESRSACVENETQIQKKLMHGENPVIQLCPYGLFNGATPIVVGHTHVANLFTGKFLFEPPDAAAMATFRQQAKKWRFNEASLIETVLDIPVVSEDKAHAIIQYLKQLSEMIAEMGLNRLNLEAAHGNATGAIETIQEISERRKIEKNLWASEARYRQLFDTANDGIFVLKDGIVIDCNPKALELFKASREEAIGQSTLAFSPEIQPDGRSSMEEIQSKRDLALKGVRQFFDWRFFRKDGSSFDAEVSVTRITINNSPHTLAIVRDISERKKMIHDLQQREKELEEKSRYLEKVNQALKASLDHREVEKRAVEENLLVNLKRSVAPYIEELGRCKIDTDAKAYLNIIKTNLNDIVSRSSNTVFWKYMDLTPTEVRIADLIRSGKNTKDIAQMLGLSPSSIQWHRKNIREKLGLTNKKINLQTYLRSLSEYPHA